jgi:hypothetical protein
VKVKPPSRTTRVELEPHEVKSLIEEIERAVAGYDRNGSTLFPLALHDFAQQLKESQR